MKEIELTKGYVTIVDDECYPYLSMFKWWVLDTHPVHSYACRWLPKIKPRVALRMHHTIIGVSASYLKKNDLVVDHIDRDGLNNQRSNLRIVDRRTNALNSERSDNATGIRWDGYRGRFKLVDLKHDKKFIGWFRTHEEAIVARASYHQGSCE